MNRKGLNDPQLPFGGFADAWLAALGRKDLNDPHTAVWGIFKVDL
jgi:hypothetical protein